MFRLYKYILFNQNYPFTPVIKTKLHKNKILYFHRVSSVITQISEIFGRLKLVDEIGKAKLITPNSFYEW